MKKKIIFTIIIVLFSMTIFSQIVHPSKDDNNPSLNPSYKKEMKIKYKPTDAKSGTAGKTTVDTKPK